MKKKSLRFGMGFRIALGNRRSEAAEMVIAPGDGLAENAITHHTGRQLRRRVALNLRARIERLDDHSRPVDEPVDRLLRLGIVEVDGDAQLAEVHCPEPCAVVDARR